jgi:hypothetical protein
MKKTAASILFLLILMVPVAAFADTGIGLVVGEPTGITFKTDNLVIGIGWSFAAADDRIDATIDWWLINDNLTEILDWYLGAGAKVRLNLNQNTDTINVGLRIPIGVQWWPAKELEVFAEIAPGLLLFPSTDFDISAGIGLRYYF